MVAEFVHMGREALGLWGVENKLLVYGCKKSEKLNLGCHSWDMWCMKIDS